MILKDLINMYEYEDDRNKVRINLTKLKESIDSEKQDTDRLIQDLRVENERISREKRKLIREKIILETRNSEITQLLKRESETVIVIAGFLVVTVAVMFFSVL